MRRQRLSYGFVTTQKGAVENLHVMASCTHGGGHVGYAERRKAEPRTVQ
jgi:predicted alpha/beta-fold hydrolase